MSVASEHPLVVHDVQGLSAFFFLGNRWVEHSILGASVLVFTPHDLGLGSFETL